MQLNEDGKNEVRKLIEKMSRDVPEGEKITLDKADLEALIFYTVRCKDGYSPKFPIWTGSFLRKIDLSGIDMCPSDVIYDLEYLIKNFGAELGKRFSLLKDKGYRIDFSYTNIDCRNLFRTNSSVTIADCNFEGVDLSYVTLYPFHFIGDEGLCVGENNNFRNTGLRIITNNDVINFSYFSFQENYDEEEVRQIREHIYRLIATGNYDGCYIDGYLIQDGKVTEQKAPDRKEELAQKYWTFKEQTIADLRADIEHQIASFGSGENPKKGGK